MSIEESMPTCLGRRSHPRAGAPLRAPAPPGCSRWSPAVRILARRQSLRTRRAVRQARDRRRSRRDAHTASRARDRSRSRGSDNRREVRPPAAAALERSTRSEEHTSELQSRGHLVCRHLLEKKKLNTDPDDADRLNADAVALLAVYLIH